MARETRAEIRRFKSEKRDRTIWRNYGDFKIRKVKKRFKTSFFYASDDNIWAINKWLHSYSERKHTELVINVFNDFIERISVGDSSGTVDICCNDDLLVLNSHRRIASNVHWDKIAESVHQIFLEINIKIFSETSLQTSLSN